MPIFPILTYDHPVLRTPAGPVTENYEGLAEFIDNMFETMYQAGGVGLAAPQVGFPLQLFVIDADELTEEEDGIKHGRGVFINPEIIPLDDENWDAEEGCLSLPDIREIVQRPNSIKIRYVDSQFRVHEEVHDGWYARVLQHEYDHLKGVLFIDYLGPFRMRLLRGKLNNIINGKVETEYLVANKNSDEQ